MVGSAIVFVVDRLGAGHLGPYGNTWLETPQFNRLAARALVCETALADSPELSAAYRAFWSGRHMEEPAAEASLALPARATERGVRTLLVTDDKSVAEHPLAAGFSECVLVDSPVAIRCASQIEQTGLFRLVAAALEAIGQQEGPLLAWIHARGMAGPWDAPREYRERLADPEDPPPPDFVQPPERRLGRHFDPDEVLGSVQAYAGQVQLCDECLGLLLEALDQHPQRQETLLAVTSPRGYPLGEHGRIGHCDEALYSELIQVPLVVQFPRGEGKLARSQRLVQPGDLYSTILESCGWGDVTAAEHSASLMRDVRGDGDWQREMACIIGPGQRAIRTAAWQLREFRAEGEVRYELFAKPDDRWEANEVASRCGEVAALLAEEIDRFERAARAGELAGLAPAAEILQAVWR